MYQRPHIRILIYHMAQSARAVEHIDYIAVKGAFGGVIIRKLDYQTFTSEFESHWVPHPYGPVPSLSKNA